MIWWLLIVFAILLVALFYWQIIIAEGTYLGPRVVAFLYDWGARSYDRVKDLDAVEEARFLACPIMERLGSGGQGDVARTLVLDVATGTGRLPLALLRQVDFRGHVIGLDLSARMLERAKQKSAWCRARLDLLQQRADRLPFREESFHLVTCLEALEFMPDPSAVIAEMVRVLRPGGVLLVSNRVGWEAKLLWGRFCGRGRMERLLAEQGLCDIRAERWQSYYDLIWARKADRGAG